MYSFHVTPAVFLADSQGRTFADVVADPACDFEAVLRFFSNEERQLRMEDAETHHDRPPLAGVIRELEDLQEVDTFLQSPHPSRSQRFRQAVGVVVRMVMEQRGWRKTGRKGALGVRSHHRYETPIHNQGGLSFWFARAERYEQIAGVPFVKVRVRHRLFLAQQQLRTDSN